jgi:hypothetical protein
VDLWQNAGRSKACAKVRRSGELDALQGLVDARAWRAARSMVANNLQESCSFEPEEYRKSCQYPAGYLRIRRGRSRNVVYYFAIIVSEKV